MRTRLRITQRVSQERDDRGPSGVDSIRRSYKTSTSRRHNIRPCPLAAPIVREATSWTSRWWAAVPSPAPAP
ncbi:hypothetical protein ACCO45_008327 [Purpureocillium lilacinum]|uniref:Uncharacterized protein n=1 Tax=Purpureocillium lilacinum TaxID=33203 RepID=A0ACC4DQD7_PURLI